VDAAWEFTGRISPRRVVRAASLDADGRPINLYPLLHPVTDAPPLTPWAVHLADAQGRFWLLCADLDAKTAAHAAARDADHLSDLLTQLQVPHVVCASGPTGGRHVWIALKESVDAAVVDVFARLAKAWLPSLDLAPLVNPVSGCVRPPGAPHRLGGASRVIAGDLSVLANPRVTGDDIRRLVERLAQKVPAALPAVPRSVRPLALTHGLPFLPGTRRALSPTSRAMVDAVPTGDLSAVLWRILCGAAAAHWRYSDVEALLDSPGLEHARTLRSGPGRTPRPAAGQASPPAVLRRQWVRAVRVIANSPHPQLPGQDVTFETRAAIITAVVRTVQSRADSTPGRWGSSRAGLAQRRVLDALCLFHLQAVRPAGVEADIRRLALTCGIDRETARRSLLALAADGWIRRTHPSSGRRGAQWTIDPTGQIHTRTSGTLSQADPRPTGTGPALRTLLTRELSDRLQTNAHDAFAPTGGLGLEAGSLYGRISDNIRALDGSRLMGWALDKTNLILERLSSAGLILRIPQGWLQADLSSLDRVAVELGTEGRQQQRADQYATERAAWEWWQTELAAMRRLATSRSTPHQAVRRSGASWPSHPRRRNGRADFAAARRALILDPPTFSAPRGVHVQDCSPFRGTPLPFPKPVHMVTQLPPTITPNKSTNPFLARANWLE